jgi:hypothetical protein
MTLAPQMALELIDEVGSRFVPGSGDGLPGFRCWLADGRARSLSALCFILHPAKDTLGSTSFPSLAPAVGLARLERDRPS